MYLQMGFRVPQERENSRHILIALLVWPWFSSHMLSLFSCSMWVDVGVMRFLGYHAFLLLKRGLASEAVSWMIKFRVGNANSRAEAVGVFEKLQENGLIVAASGSNRGFMDGMRLFRLRVSDTSLLYPKN